jgi:hypothetical protein
MLLAIVSLSLYIILHIAVEVWKFYKGDSVATIVTHMAVSLIPLITFWSLVTSVEGDLTEVNNPWILIVEACVRLTVTSVVLGSLILLSLSRFLEDKKEEVKK